MTHTTKALPLLGLMGLVVGVLSGDGAAGRSSGNQLAIQSITGSAHERYDV